MNNNISIFMLLSLYAIVLITLVISIVQKNMRNLSQIFYSLSFCFLGWLLCEILYFAVDIDSNSQIFFNLKLPFVAFSAESLLILVIRFYRKEDKLNLQFIFALSVIPIITTIVALTSDYHNLLRPTFKVISSSPERIIEYSRGFWFWIHSIYCYLLMIISLVIILVQHRKLPKGYRLPSTILGIGILLSMTTNIISLSEKVESPIDLTIIGMSVSLIFIYVAISGNSTADFLSIARNNIFHYLEEIVFILNNDKFIVDCNYSADNWLAGLGIDKSKFIYFPEILKFLEKKGAKINYNEDDEAGIDIYLSDESRYVFYNLKERIIYSKDNHPIGRYATFFDATRYRTIINNLEIAAGIDSLTGLSNRRIFEQEKIRLDAPNYLPLSIVICDVNKLKVLNDTKGHHSGDLLLRIVAKTLKSTCPKNSVVARIGGDEFVIMLPNTDKLEASSIMSLINKNLINSKTNDFTPSLAMGSTTKKHPHQDLDELIKKADFLMYQQKGRKR